MDWRCEGCVCENCFNQLTPRCLDQHQQLVSTRVAPCAESTQTSTSSPAAVRCGADPHDVVRREHSPVVRIKLLWCTEWVGGRVGWFVRTHVGGFFGHLIGVWLASQPC